MLYFHLQSPVEPVLFGEFVSPERGWKHLTRVLYEYEMMIVTEGVLWIADENEEYEVRAGEYLIMPPNRRQHGTRECRCKFYWLHFRADALPASFSLPAKGAYRDGERIRAFFELLSEADSEEQGGIRARYLATEILLELGCRKEDAKEKSAREALCDKVKNYVWWHRFSQMRIAEMARELGYHEKYLSAVFHQTEGVTLKKYVTQTRLKEAKRLLAETRYTAKEVADYLNFESPHNFSRCFKNETGITPTQYRNHAKKEATPLGAP